MRSKIALHGQNSKNRLTDSDGDRSGIRDPGDDMAGTRDLRGMPISDDRVMREIEHRAPPVLSAGVDRSDGRRNADYDRVSSPPHTQEPPEYRDERRDGMAGGAPHDGSFDVVTPQPTYGGPPNHSSRR